MSLSKELKANPSEMKDFRRELDLRTYFFKGGR
jgi:hypothetical protein